MLIVVAGIKRSGSTAQFNMIRLVLEEYFGKDMVETTGTPKEALELNADNKIVILKYHPFDRVIFEYADYIFTTSRPIEDIKQSMLRFYGVDNMPKRGLSVMQKHLRKWQDKSLNQPFSLIKNQPFIALNSIIEYMSLDFYKEDVRQIFKEFECLRPPKEGYDNTTFMFSNHITKK